MHKLCAAAAKTIAQRLPRDDRGATAVEYGLIVALIAAIIVTVVQTLGSDIASTLTKVANAIGGG
jgi:pilus assembly protein Flp/PilA